MMPTVEVLSMQASLKSNTKRICKSIIYDYMSLLSSLETKSLYNFYFDNKKVCIIEKSIRSLGRDVRTSAPLHPRKMQRFS
jgi:hypothetical protein